MNKINQRPFAETDVDGYAHVEVKVGDIGQGSFTYTLVVNNQQVDSKKMILIND